MSARSIAAFAWMLAAVALGAPALAADAANGERLARQWCASCHVVSVDQQQASTDAPPFATIGRTPGLSAEKLALFLLDPHPKMPNMALTRREAADLAEYIMKTAR
jgi:mono/diheme cytochrome c family protein